MEAMWFHIHQFCLKLMKILWNIEAASEVFIFPLCENCHVLLSLALTVLYLTIIRCFYLVVTETCLFLAYKAYLVIRLQLNCRCIFHFFLYILLFRKPNVDSILWHCSTELSLRLNVWDEFNFSFSSGQYMMTTSKAGRAVCERRTFRCVDHWKRKSLKSRLSVFYRMGHELLDMGFALRPFILNDVKNLQRSTLCKRESDFDRGSGSQETHSATHILKCKSDGTSRDIYQFIDLTNDDSWMYSKLFGLNCETVSLKCWQT